MNGVNGSVAVLTTTTTTTEKTVSTIAADPDKANNNDNNNISSSMDISSGQIVTELNNEDRFMEHEQYSTDEMLESEKSSLFGRVHDLERRVLTQQDEIVCLRSTLADVLRRLNTIEGNIERGAITNNTLGIQGGRSAPNTPSRNGAPVFSRLSSQSSVHSNSSMGMNCGQNNDWKLRKPMVRSVQGTTTPDMHSRRHSGGVSSLHQSRTKPIHQSNGSIQSDSPSSNSISPAPSPSPRPQSVNTVNNGNAGLGKRWNSTGDFNAQSALVGSTQTCSYNEDDGTVKMFLRGRPVILNATSDVKEIYDVTKVQPAPNKKLKLDWVYGYRGKDCRSNLYQLPTGEMAYFVASVIVLYNVDEQSQRHYIGHTDDVKSLCIHPNKLLVATGQCAGHNKNDALPHIRIWNSVSLATLMVIGVGEFTGSINSLCFSRADSGSMIVAIDDSADKIISVWEWQRGEKGHKITETRCSVDTIVAVEFHPLDRNQIVSAGKGHIAFWTLDQNGTLYKRMGVFEGREKPKYVTCLAFTQSGDVVSGDSNGNILVWSRGTNTITRLLKKVHDGSIFALCALKDGGFLSGGGKDGRIKLFDADLSPTGIEMEIEQHFGAVRVVAEGKGSQLLIGTTRNCILTGNMQLGFSPVIMGHTDEVWGLAIHPNMPQFVTGGRDRLLQLWDSLSHSVVWSKDIGEQIQCCAFSVDGAMIAVGTVFGKWIIFDALTREALTQHIDGQEAIQAIEFSPDGKLMAIGSRDNNIYIYQVGDDYRRFAKVGRCAGHSSYVKHVDWSEDSQVLRSNSGDYEVLYWNPTLCRQITSSSTTNDIKWATQNCSLSFQTIGVWPEHADGTDINAVCKNFEGSLMASGDDFGKVKLFLYPATQPKTLSHSYGGHSSHVTDVKFMHDDARLISTGGNDTSVMQWVVS
ncbi:echinoderm microtubule-associated protein-like 2 isoform X2 [Sitodiplosis mosellana]|uniref:echinoderm microtubule-associated protein-like 2 isoform X2 n=1 Tax=Sitodiplosis mosellana TaxID=263140 RepID=UPI002443D019|nr:echinoderm microtubule-associated protein-like 2 isoform X2 [Sitodiplosis mosellana]XP_055316075.1 echinoderm microtubule-associated protein-like 2 isoform X2 [Sitodiplosis mosellana]XP_055316076.1 echinoderm microtubule-associated protein-like 2 isoform X2 [Sitodiplosis mosellana]XP_055316078.1 echinoderm microtubule-associated protein-like 2 isoform X2 [Sitodiplosis mosellana]XP_055316079.1 echinoderm microtubule-associated protein-like 2 isoform X2 [Sitodiplosis mosellana]XP_055316080.1 